MRKNALNRGHSFYNELEISSAASLEEIKDAYRRLAKEYHPDVNPSEDARLRFAAIQKAYSVLSDNELRLQYDRNRGILQVEVNTDFMASTQKVREEIKFSPEVENTAFLDRSAPPEEKGFFKKIQSLFQEPTAPGLMNKELVRHKIKETPPEKERIYTFSVSPVEALTGTTRTVVLRLSGKETKREINIPPVTKSPTKIKLRLPKPDNKTGIDEIKVQINILSNINFKREGSDIHLKLPFLEQELNHPVTLTIATALGFETITLTKEHLRTPLIITSGGLLDVERAIHGDLFVTARLADIDSPKAASEEIIAERNNLLFSLTPLNKKSKPENIHR